ncbi:MAG: aldolase/citrate lyase family protein [Bacteroidales bacterium]
MNGKELREALRSGKRVYGTMIVSPSPRWIDVISQLNIDFVFIDTEHIAIDRHQLSWMCHGYAGKGIVPVVRIPAPDPYQACMAMDAGAKGVVAPYVEKVEEVLQLKGAVKTRPIKGKKLLDFLNGIKPFEPELNEYIEKNNENHVLIINIESQAAIDHLDEMVRVPGLDAVLIGPHDLSCNLGVPEQYDHPVFKKAVEKIFMTARSAGIGAGIHVFYNDSVKWEIEWAGKGANLILHSGDINRFSQVIHDDISTLRKALDGQSGSAVGDVNM